MQIDSETLDNGILKVNLTGRMDVLGTPPIDKKFTALMTAPNAPILVDISGVSFLASIGMRTLLSSAKTAAQRGRLMVLYKPQPNVREVLESSGLSHLIPVYDELQEAMDVLISRRSG